MSLLLTRLLDQLKQRGLSVVAGKEPGVLLLSGPNGEKTQQVVDALKAFKPELLEMFKSPQEPEPEPLPVAEPAAEPKPAAQLICHVCGRDASDPEDRDRLADALFCPRAGTRQAVVDGNGVTHPQEARCPFKARP